jgi:hypothetical protein
LRHATPPELKVTASSQPYRKPTMPSAKRRPDRRTTALERRIAQLRAELEGVKDANRGLRRALEEMELDAERVTPPPPSARKEVDRITRVRSMLRDSASRNP